MQTILSWLSHNKDSTVKVLSTREIQKKLIEIGDKEESFLNSKDWIGSVEVGFIIDSLFDVPCKIVHIANGRDLKDKSLSVLKEHFDRHGSPVMMGGNVDAASKGVFGVKEDSLLIVDPHYYGKKGPNCGDLVNRGYLGWKKWEEFIDSSFYNLCIPQFWLK